MSDEAVGPALTPEEWATWRDRGWTDSGDGVAVQVGVPHKPADTLLRVFSSSGVGGVPDRHGLAALCLHEQPYGFTHEMADAIRMCARNFPGIDIQGDGEHHKEARALAEAAAARIEALLPPRGS